MKIRKAMWAGQFYPENPKTLRDNIEGFLKHAKDIGKRGRIVGIIAPHAGYSYSGRVAAAAYKQIRGESYETVVVLAPSHSAYIKQVSVYDGDYYETPLGQISIDKTNVQNLAAHGKNIQISDSGHALDGDRAEHSLEVQLPFLQVVLDSFTLVPIVFHDFRWENCFLLGEAIANTFDPQKTLIVASSDLYHGNSYNECKRVDQLTIGSFTRDNPKDFCFGSERGDYMACGAGPITALKVAALAWKGYNPRIVERTNSNDVIGVQGGYVVGYASAIVELEEAKN